MEKLKIPKESAGVSKTFRIPEDVIEDMEILSKLKNHSLNRTTIYLLRFALNNLDLEDKNEIEIMKNNKKG